MPRSFQTLTKLFLALAASGVLQLSVTYGIARADDDPFSEILQSKDLLDRKGLKRAKRSKLKYAMGPWFQQGTNFEKLFTYGPMAEHLIEWVAPVGKQFLVAEPDEDHEDTHIHAEAIVQERATRIPFALTVLVPHPAFMAVIDGKLVEDFAQRMPPMLPVEVTETFKVQGFDATAYWLKNDKCTVVMNVAHHTMVEVRSVEECGSLATIKALAQSLNLVKLDQKLQS